MDITTLKGLVQTALKSAPFSISGATLASADITTLFSAQFGSDALVLNGASQQSESATSIIVSGTLASPYLGAPNLTVTATFTVVGTTAEVAATVSGLPSDWTMSTAYPSLKGTLFDSFAYASPTFTLASNNAPALPASFPSGYGMAAYPASIADALVPGLSFQATASVSAGLTGIGWLLGGDSWSLSGPIEIVSNLPSIALASAPGTEIPIGAFSVAFSVTLAAAIVVPGDGSAPTAVTSVLQFEADITKQLTSSVLQIPIYARTFTPSLATLTIEGELSDLTLLTVPDIAALIGADIGGQIPTEFPALNDIGIRSVALTVAPATQTLVSASVAIEFQPKAGQTWGVFNNMIVFDGMSVTFTWLPSVSAVDTAVEATATIAGGTVAAGVTLPDTGFYCVLESGSINIAEIVANVSNNTISMPAVNCTELNFSGSVSDNQYRFQATVTDDWSFTLGTKSLAITQVGMDLTYASGAASPLTGQVIGTFDIAGTTLYASAEYDGGDAGWTFSGGTVGSETIDVNAIVDDVLSLFGVQLPGNAPDVTLSNLNVTFNTGTSAFTFKGMAAVTIAGTDCDFGVNVSHDQTGTVFNGYIWIGDNAFELDFSVGSATVFAGKWTPLDGSSSSLSLSNLIKELGLPIDNLPSSLDLTLTGADIVYDKTNDNLVAIADMESGSSLLFVVAAGKSPVQIGFAALAKDLLNLSNLPLVGQELAKIATISIDQLQISVSNQPLGAVGAQFNTLVGGYADFLSGLTYPSFPSLSSGATTKAYLSATFDYGTGTLPIAFALDGGTTTGGSTSLRLRALAADGPVGSGGSVTSSTSSDGAFWFNVQRSFGPVTIQRIGAMYQSDAQTLWFELDASLAFGPLALSLIGLGVGSPISSFHPDFMLRGLGISYSEPPLTIAGSFVNLAPPGADYIEFEGGVTIGAEDFTITAFGYYGNQSGFSSMFIFGDIAYDFGGPPAFFVTGLALGFGYNSALRIPTIDQVGTFPFIEVLPTSMAPSPNVFGGANPTPLTALTAILGSSPPWVSPTKGSLWFMAGVTFTSFELVNSQALIAVQLGQDLVIALLGTSRAQFPQPIAGDTDIPTYAYIELDLEAIFAPDDGLFSVQAVLASTSFLLDRACVLTGGFAFFVWFGKNPHSGDFVLTLGGYNPGFTPPAYYPAVPRVGFHWSLDSSISIQGGAYFALTPAALMFGGELSATYQSGNLKAWFDAHADVLVQWKPFWFTASVGISIGASYRINMGFTTATVTVELGCDLELWGPPTGGTVTVDWYIISFTIPFGNSTQIPPHAQEWSDVATMLPSNGTSGPNPISISPAAGLHSATTSPPSGNGASSAGRGRAAQAADPPPSPAPWIVRGGTFAFSTNSPIPATTVTTGGATAFNGTSFNVFPLVASNAAWQNVTATHAITITPVDGTGGDMSGAFSAVPVMKSVPASLWGSPPNAGGQPQVPSGSQQLVANQIVGVIMTVNPPQIGASAGPVDVATSLAFDALREHGDLPLLASAQPAGDVATFSPTTLGLIASATNGIAAPATVTTRGNILTALRSMSYAPATANDPMTLFAAEVGCGFAAVPLLVS